MRKKSVFNLLIIVAASVLSCAKLGEEKTWNNPGDPDGVNWFPPVVHAPGDTDVAVNDTTLFLASGSDENGSVVRCRWSLDHGNTWSDGSGPLGTRMNFLQAGVKTAWVQAEDDDGVFSAPDSFTVTVHEYRPIVHPVADTVVSQLAEVAISAAAADTNGAIVRYYWKSGPEEGWSDSSETPDRTFRLEQGGALTVLWGARDHDGYVATDTFTILFNRGPDMVKMAAPADGGVVPFVSFDYIGLAGKAKLRFEAQDPDSSADQITFRLQMGEDPAALTLRYAGSDSVYQIDSLLPSATYYWRLSASDRFGDSTASTGSFKMQGAPGGPAGMVLIRSAGRSFRMGYGGGESYERPVHQAGFSYNFWIDSLEVSRRDFDSLVGGAAMAVDPLLPVANVNWYDAVLYCNARSKRDKRDTVYRYAAITGVPGKNCVLMGVEQTTASGYRLPTEAEWEYACRAGSTTDYYWGNNRDDAVSYAWFRDNSSGSVNRPGLKKPNAFNAYDMAGNLWEWCNDWFGADYYSSSPATDPNGPAEGTERVIRGGSWMHSDYFTGSGVRSRIMPSSANSAIGFRVVLQNP